MSHHLTHQPPLYNERYEHDACGIGFVAQKDGRRSNEVLRLAVNALRNHVHRGAVAADGKSGDGAGVLTQIPHELIARHLATMGITAPRRATWRWAWSSCRASTWPIGSAAARSWRKPWPNTGSSGWPGAMCR